VAQRWQPRSKRRGIVTPFPIQALVLPDALAGLDVLAKAPTGSGKTLAFALPIVERRCPGDGTPSVSCSYRPASSLPRWRPELELVASQKGLRAAAVYGGAPNRGPGQAARGAICSSPRPAASRI